MDTKLRFAVMFLPFAAACGGMPVGTTTEGFGGGNVAINNGDATVHRYRFTVDNFWISKTRSKFTDTLYLTMEAHANTDYFVVTTGAPTATEYQEWGPLSWDNSEGFWRLGNFGDGGHNIDPATISGALGLPGFDARNDQLVELAVGLQNDCAGTGGYAGSGATTQNQPYYWEYSPSYTPPATTEFAAGPIWPENLQSLTQHEGTGAFGCLCDGVVATDGMLVYGRDLEALTANGPYTRTAYVPGSNSPAGCGNNSVYYMTWTLSRDY
jgi:hypothetical protein